MLTASENIAAVFKDTNRINSLKDVLGKPDNCGNPALPVINTLKYTLCRSIKGGFLGVISILRKIEIAPSFL